MGKISYPQKTNKKPSGKAYQCSVPKTNLALNAIHIAEQIAIITNPSHTPKSIVAKKRAREVLKLLQTQTQDLVEKLRLCEERTQPHWAGELKNSVYS